MFKRSAMPEGPAESSKALSAVNAVISAIGGAETVEAAVGAALASVRSEFGWAYGSYSNQQNSLFLTSGIAGILTDKLKDCEAVSDRYQYLYLLYEGQA